MCAHNNLEPHLHSSLARGLFIWLKWNYGTPVSYQQNISTLNPWLSWGISRILASQSQFKQLIGEGGHEPKILSSFAVQKHHSLTRATGLKVVQCTYMGCILLAWQNRSVTWSLKVKPIVSSIMFRFPSLNCQVSVLPLLRDYPGRRSILHHKGPHICLVLIHVASSQFPNSSNKTLKKPVQYEIDRYSQIASFGAIF